MIKDLIAGFFFFAFFIMLIVGFVSTNDNLSATDARALSNNPITDELTKVYDNILVQAKYGADGLIFYTTEPEIITDLRKHGFLVSTDEEDWQKLQISW